MTLLVGCAGAPRQPAAVHDLLIDDVTVVDVASGALLAHRRVLIDGESITAVLERHGPPPRARVRLDGRGRFLLPGLWDMHVHALWSGEARRHFLPAFVRMGVVGIRDMGGDFGVLAEARADLAGGAPLPRIVAAGQVLDGPEPIQAEISVGAQDAEAARQRVRELKDKGADFIKVYTLLPRDAYFAAVEEARSLGLPVAGHVPADVGVVEAAAAGQRSIEHLRDEIEPFCTLAASAECLEILRKLRQYDAWQVPTLVALHAKATLDDPARRADPRLASLPASLAEEWRGAIASKARRPAGYFEDKRRRFDGELALVLAIAREGVGLLAGSDAGVAFAYPGDGLHEELALMVRAGLSPREALATATLGPARFLGRADRAGSVQAGHDADLLLLSADPLRDIAATRRIEAVVLRGKLLHEKDPAP